MPGNPIDAPAPPWRLMPAKEVGEEASTEPPIDKAQLAKELAAKAMADLEQKKQAEKAELAKRLAAEAKAKAEKKKKADLAKKLAEEAKARTDKERKAKLAQEEADAAKAQPEKKAKAKKSKPARSSRTLADRAGKPVKKQKLSAQEALAAALAAEDTEPAPEKAANAAPTPPEPASEPVASAPEPSEVPATVADDSEILRPLKAALPGCTITVASSSVSNIAVFKALWKAHATQAAKSGDVALYAVANQLIAASQSGPVHAVGVRTGNRTWAVFLYDNGAIIGAVTPADTYLAGVS